VWRLFRIPQPQPCESQKATKRELGAWGYNCPILSLGDIRKDIWSSRLGFVRNTDDLALQKKNIFAKFKEVKTGWSTSQE
jgi:hypothetical protein